MIVPPGLPGYSHCRALLADVWSGVGVGHSGEETGKTVVESREKWRKDIWGLSICSVEAHN